MKKIILEEVNRNRQIMGLKPIMEQWEDNILKNLGLDAEKILAKAEADLIPVEKSFITSIEKYAGPDTDKVLRSLEKNTLKDEFPLISKKLEQELFYNADQSIAKATQDAFYSKFPDAGAIKQTLESEELSNLVKQYEAKGKVSEIEYQLNATKKEIESLPDGFFKDELLKSFESKFGKSKSTTEINLRKLLADFKAEKNRYSLEWDKIIEAADDNGYVARYTKGNGKRINEIKSNIKKSLDSLEKLMSDGTLKGEFDALLKEIKGKDTSILDDMFYYAFDLTKISPTIKRMWKTTVGKIAVILIGTSIAGSLGFKLASLSKYRCYPVIKQALSVVFDVSDCSEKPKESQEDDKNKSSTETPQTSETPTSIKDATVEEFVNWWNSKYTPINFDKNTSSYKYHDGQSVSLDINGKNATIKIGDKTLSYIKTNDNTFEKK